MKKIISNFKYLKLKDLIDFFILIFLVPFAIIYKTYLKISNKKIWLIMEEGITANDNGYHFFKYLRENQPHIAAYYVIDKKVKDYSKISKYNNIIQYKSVKHWIYYLTAYYNISSQKSGNPSPAVFYFIHVKLKLLNNRVFLQHGITINKGDWLDYKNTNFKYFICGAKKEYKFISTMFNYPKENIFFTGFPRYDNLHCKTIKNQIIIMPTWRNWLGRDTNKLQKTNDFTESKYYKTWSNLLNNIELTKFIEKNDIDVYFYQHIHMQKFNKDFKSKSENIKVIDKDTKDIQELLIESSLLITDYSSVSMDFAYMKKPLIYYQFDLEEYRKKQLKEGCFSYEKDGFGPIMYKESELIDEIIKCSEKKYIMDQKYFKKVNKFFEISDKNNCKRIYQILINGVDKL